MATNFKVKGFRITLLKPGMPLYEKHAREAGVPMYHVTGPKTDMVGTEAFCRVILSTYQE